MQTYVANGRIIRVNQISSYKENGHVLGITLAVSNGKGKPSFVSGKYFDASGKVEKTLKEGRAVAVTGKLISNSFEKDGQVTYSQDLVLNSIELGNNKKAEEAETEAAEA